MAMTETTPTEQLAVFGNPDGNYRDRHNYPTPTSRFRFEFSSLQESEIKNWAIPPNQVVRRKA